jgi:predicted enzyme related to lactoylglutathione lyase
VSGTWLDDRPPSSEPGLLLYINVESVERGLERIVAAGGEVVTPLTPQGEGEAFATFRDPAGNVLGIFQERGAVGQDGP